MIFDLADEKDIRAHLKSDNWTGRWEGRRAACSLTLCMIGETGSLRVSFSVRRGVRIYRGDDTLLRVALERVDTICREDADKIHERWEEAPPEPITGTKRVSAKKAGPKGNGTRPNIMGYGVCQILQWMGAHGYSTFDAVNALESFGAECSKKTISRAMDKGRHPERDGIDVVELPDDVITHLEHFRDLARKTG